MPTVLDLTPDELLTTTRSVRKRLDLARPVEREVLEACLEVALQAPTGSNQQGWQWVVVTDAGRRAALAELYASMFDPYFDQAPDPFGPDDIRTRHRDAVRSSAQYLRDHLHEVPVHVIPCIQGRPPTGDPKAGATIFQASWWGSILPAVWSFMLALRARGLGSAWTTLHLGRERRAAELLGIPFDGYTQVGLFPVAYTKGTDFRPAARVPLDQVVHWDTW
jgi:nitroreductase